MITRCVAIAATLLLAACASTSSPSPMPTPTVPLVSATAAPTPAASGTALPTASSPAVARPVMRGDLFTMTAEADMISFFADGSSLLAYSTKDGPSPYLSKIQRADPPTGSWRTIFSDDAHFIRPLISAGRMALSEYREDGEGAHNLTVLLLDLRSGATTTIDRYALSKATFRGGGGAPRRAVGGLLALGPNSIAWTHAYELPGGVVEAELRVAAFADLARATSIGRSREWIEPISVNDRTLLYIAGGTERDELRSRDLATGRERVMAELRAPTQTSGRDGPIVAGAWAGWMDHPPMPGAPDAKPGSPTTAIFRAVHIETGVLRERALPAGYCHGLTANASYFVWDCGGPRTTAQAFEPDVWIDRDVVSLSAATPFVLSAVDSGFLWTDAHTGARRVTLFTLRP